MRKHLIAISVTLLSVLLGSASAGAQCLGRVSVDHRVVEMSPSKECLDISLHGSECLGYLSARLTNNCSHSFKLSSEDLQFRDGNKVVSPGATKTCSLKSIEDLKGKTQVESVMHAKLGEDKMKIKLACRRECTTVRKGLRRNNHYVKRNVRDGAKRPAQVRCASAKGCCSAAMRLDYL